jgi:hypothetical protein
MPVTHSVIMFVDQGPLADKLPRQSADTRQHACYACKHMAALQIAWWEHGAGLGYVK